jgi:hypothetical protein
MRSYEVLRREQDVNLICIFPECKRCNKHPWKTHSSALHRPTKEREDDCKCDQW